MNADKGFLTLIKFLTSVHFCAAARAAGVEEAAAGDGAADEGTTTTTLRPREQVQKPLPSESPVGSVSSQVDPLKTIKMY